MANKDNKTAKALADMDDDDEIIMPATQEDAAPEIDDADMDWKAAAAKLKSRVSKMTDSIDDYFVKQEVNALRERYNAKERTPDLYAALMALEV